MNLVVPPSLRNAHREGFARYLATGQSRILGKRLELSGVRADGTEFPVELTIVRVPVDGPPVFAGYVRDISEQRQMEDQLRQAQKMEAIGNLAGGVAHDFNNILMVIRTSASLLLSKIDDEPARQDVMRIDTAADRAAKLTRELLAFGRRQMLRPELHQLNDIVSDAIELVQSATGEHVEVVCELGAEVPPVLIDRTQVEQVLLNLAVNARDAMPDGGTLTIRTARVVLDELFASEGSDLEPGPHVLLQVTDSGTGMEHEAQEQAFDPFFTTKDQGTGLGLATVYGIVKQSSGQIWLYSEPGLGTTFKIYFPLAVVERDAAVETEVSTLHGGETILVAEDDDAVRRVVAEALRFYGYQVLEASDGPEAIELARQHDSIDLIVTDVVMPGMTGRELVERLVVERPTLKALFTSGYPADAVLRRGIEQAEVAFIEKPYLPGELALKVREVLAAPGGVGTGT